MSEPNRRQFLIVAGAAACTCMMGGSPACADETPAGPVDVGTLADYPTDGVYDRFARPHKVVVIRHEGRLFACSAICTHKRQTLRVKDGVLGCPSHGSKFSMEGVAAGGPATGVLERYALTRGEDGRILVDKTRTFDQAGWDMAEAFIKV